MRLSRDPKAARRLCAPAPRMQAPLICQSFQGRQKPLVTTESSGLLIFSFYGGAIRRCCQWAQCFGINTRPLIVKGVFPKLTASNDAFLQPGPAQAFDSGQTPTAAQSRGSEKEGESGEKLHVKNDNINLT